MTEYWKSQGRKFCDFCKCWIADNRPSIEFHERGKKHQENVNKRLKEIHKNTTKQAKEQKRFESDYKKMEKAAMAAYLKDIENDNVDMTAKNFIHEKANLEAKIVEEKHDAPMQHFSTSSQPKPTSSGKNKSHGGKGKNKKGGQTKDVTVKPKSATKLWYEARTPEGYTYYWNIETNESIWEVPEDGFVSVEEQEKQAQEKAIQEQFLAQIKKEEEEQNKDILEEQRANKEREKMKEIRDKIKKEKEEEEEKVPYMRNYSVPEKPQPYGAWKPVVEVKPEVVDLQLPEKKQIGYVPDISYEPLMKNFKEKQISHLTTGDSDDDGTGEPLKFKKRKIGNKSLRRKTSDD